MAEKSVNNPVFQKYAIFSCYLLVILFIDAIGIFKKMSIRKKTGPSTAGPTKRAHVTFFALSGQKRYIKISVIRKISVFIPYIREAFFPKVSFNKNIII